LVLRVVVEQQTALAATAMATFTPSWLSASDFVGGVSG
jgi:hypothetical protein